MLRQKYIHLPGIFCDWYIEIIKDDMNQPEDSIETNKHLFILFNLLKICHPFMPFMTEELNNILKGTRVISYLKLAF